MANIANNIGLSDVTILTLKDSAFNTEIYKFNKDVKVISLSLSLFNVVSSLKIVKNCLLKENPDVIHTQGFFADFIISQLSLFNSIWVSTIRNFPYEDYPFKYNKFLGYLMAFIHIKSLKKCKNLVACSKYIKDKLNNFKIDSTYINNVSSVVDDGVQVTKDIDFLILGSLIPRKNNIYILNHIKNNLDEYKYKKFCFVGSGSEYELLTNFISSNELVDVSFIGQVKNPLDYLKRSRFILSSSMSEGLPNNVLEALNLNISCILSDIEPHKYFQSYTDNVYVYENEEQLLDYLKNSTNFIKPTSPSYFEVFSIKNLTQSYLSVYQGVKNEKI